MFSVANRAGDLLEIRAASPFTMEDATELFKQIYKLMPRGRKGRVMCDLRGLRVVDPAIIDLVTGFMKQDNPFVERNAFLLPDSGALLHIQSDRMLKQVGADTRRSFRDRAEAETWMREILTIAERARLASFLDEGETG
jgi:hypothetical protein